MKWDYNGELSNAKFVDWEVEATRVLYNDESVSNMDVGFQTFREVCFKSCKLSKVNFNNVYMVKVKFINCELENVNFLESNFSKLEFIGCKFTSVSIFETKLEDVFFNESIIQYSKIENSIISNSLFDDIKFKENLHRKSSYSKTDFYKCELIEENLIDTKFNCCDLKTSIFKSVSLNIDDLITSKLSVLNMIDILSDKGIIIED